MSRLDTDHLGIWQRNRGREFESLMSKLATVEEMQVYVTIVSFHAQVAGWTKYVKGSLDQSRIVFGYSRLRLIIQNFGEAQVLSYSASAAEVFEGIRGRKVRIATMDLRIAAIAIAEHMILVTQNTGDFDSIPELQLATWT